MAGCGGNVNEFLGVARVNDFGERKCRFANFSAMLPAAGGNDDFLRLAATLHRMGDNVLLQNAVVAESGAAGFKNGETTQSEMVQKIFPERAEVRAIAEEAWREADGLAAGVG